MKKQPTKAQNIIIFIIIVLIPGCELFQATPFPEYLGNIIAEHRYASTIADIFPDSSQTRYQLLPFEYNNLQHIYLLISPTFDASNLAATRAVLFHLSGEGEYQRTIRIPEEAEFNLRSNFGLPFLLSNSPNRVVSGRVTINPDTHEVDAPFEHELEGGYWYYDREQLP